MDTPANDAVDIAEALKQQRRDNLAKARLARSEKARLRKLEPPVVALKEHVVDAMEGVHNGHPHRHDFSHIDWQTIPYAQGMSHLANLQRLWESASSTLRQRQQAADIVECACGCGRTFPPQFACMSESRYDDKQMPFNVYYATQECVRQRNKKRLGMAEMIK